MIENARISHTAEQRKFTINELQSAGVESETWIAFFQNTYEKMLRFAIPKYGSEAEDYVASAMLGFFEKLPKLSPNRDIEWYLIRSIMNKGTSEWRKRNKGPVRIIYSSEDRQLEEYILNLPSSTDIMEEVTDKVIVSDILFKVAPRQRATLIFDAFSFKGHEIATKLNMKIGTVKATKHKGKNNMRRIDVDLGLINYDLFQSHEHFAK